MTARVFSWDWKAQPDLPAIAAAVTELSGGRAFMREIDTGGDNYAWVISDAELTDEQAYRLYSGEDEEHAPEPDWRFEWDVPRLLAAIDAVLKLAGEWEADIAELVRDIARARKSHHASDHVQAHADEAVAAEIRQCANGVREAITRELTGKEPDHG